MSDTLILKRIWFVVYQDMLNFVRSFGCYNARNEMMAIEHQHGDLETLHHQRFVYCITTITVV